MLTPFRVSDFKGAWPFRHFNDNILVLLILSRPFFISLILWCFFLHVSSGLSNLSTPFILPGDLDYNRKRMFSDERCSRITPPLHRSTLNTIPAQFNEVPLFNAVPSSFQLVCIPILHCLKKLSGIPYSRNCYVHLKKTVEKFIFIFP